MNIGLSKCYGMDWNEKEASIPIQRVKIGVPVFCHGEPWFVILFENIDMETL